MVINMADKLRIYIEQYKRNSQRLKKKNQNLLMSKKYKKVGSYGFKSYGILTNFRFIGY